MDNFADRGRHKIEDQHPELVAHIRAIVDPESQADPKFQTAVAFTRLTAKAVCQRLATQASNAQVPRPAERTMHNILNRLGYRLRRVRKSQPQKRFPKPTPSSGT